MTGGKGPSRRRFIAIAAAAAGLPLLPGKAGAVPQWSWEGRALGAAARIQLCHPDRAVARNLVEGCVAELERLESAFSLYRDDSEISRLNRNGALDDPTADFVALMLQAQEWGRRTDGAFDFTVQPLWRLYADHFAAPGHDPSGPTPRRVAAALASVDYRAVDIGRRRVGFAKPGMAVTLNGIAQGYITDRISHRLRNSGIQSTLVEMGEIAGVGLRGDGTPWQVELRGAGIDAPDLLSLSNQAVATSAGGATPFDSTGRFHHLLRPRSGDCASWWRTLTVVADTATSADALSTALYVAPRDDAHRIVARLEAEGSSVQVFVWRDDGARERFCASTEPSRISYRQT